MRKAIILLMVMAIAGGAIAQDGGNSRELPKKITSNRTYTPPAEVKVGGDDINDATFIPTLPYSDIGNTCNFLDDYDISCPSGSISPDVVYLYIPTVDINITVDLCGSSYDTKTFILDSDLNPVACNDDFYYDAICGWYVSFIENASLMGGQSYYIVIDGWDGDCGDYVLNVTEYEPPPPCEIICVADAVHEDEPMLVDEYIDAWNGGCNSVPPVFQDIYWSNTLEGEAWLCGVSGWYLLTVDGIVYNYRDTDWFTATADDSGTMSFTVESEYPCYLFHMIVDEFCEYIIAQQTIADCGSPATLTVETNPGEVIVWWVGPTVFASPDGTPEFPYFATLTGHEWDPPVPTEEVSWGGVKALYR